MYITASKLFKPNLDYNLLEEIKQKYNLDEFILYVSNIYRYKNFFELIQAFSLIKNKIDPNLKLALVGKSFDNKYTEALKAFVLNKEMRDRVIFLVIFLMKNYLVFIPFVSYLYIPQHVNHLE